MTGDFIARPILVSGRALLNHRFLVCERITLLGSSILCYPGPHR